MTKPPLTKKQIQSVRRAYMKLGSVSETAIYCDLRVKETWEILNFMAGIDTSCKEKRKRRDEKFRKMKSK